MIDCPKLIAELDRLARLCHEADRKVWLCIHGKLDRELWTLQADRDRAESDFWNFRDEHGLAACLSRYASCYR